MLVEAERDVLTCQVQLPDERKELTKRNILNIIAAHYGPGN